MDDNPQEEDRSEPSKNAVGVSRGRLGAQGKSKAKVGLAFCNVGYLYQPEPSFL